MSRDDRVASVTTTLVDLPLRRPHPVANAVIDHQSVVLVRLRDHASREGIGEAVLPGGPWWSGDTIEGVKSLVDEHLGPAVVGRDPRQVEAAVRVLEQTVNGGRFAKAAVEMALWDLLGKQRDLPLHDLLGGRSRDSVPVTWAVGVVAAEEAIDEIERRIEHGAHRSFKLKMGAGDPGRDVARIADIAHAVGARASLRVDLNGAWDEMTAARHLPSLAEAGIELVEQPVAGWNLGAMRRLGDESSVPIMADESLLTTHDAVRIASEGAARVLAVKLGKSGGLSAALRITAIAEASGMRCHGGTAIESSIGTAAAAHVFCSAPGLDYGSELFGPLLLADDLVEEPVAYVDGEVRPPTGPGLGVALDEARVAAYTRHSDRRAPRGHRRLGPPLGREAQLDQEVAR